MCIDGDNADHIAEYVNSQLHSLHRIAENCALHYHSNHEDLSSRPGYDFALAEFHHKTESPLSSAQFNARFDAPTLEFICNHDALLHLHVIEAEITTSRVTGGYGGASPAGGPPSAGVAPASLRMHGVISVRVPFVTFDLEGKADVLGGGVHNLHHLILDFPRATFVHTRETSAELEDAFKPSFIAYLDHLRKSGHHILNGLPGFDDKRFTRTFDFTSGTHHSYSHITEMFKIHRDKIITHIGDTWRKSAWSMRGGAAKSPFNRPSIAIAEWSSLWSPAHDGEQHFWSKFGAPRIELLCEREAILYIQVDEVNFSWSTSFHPTEHLHRGWEIAVIVNINHFTEEDGSVEILNIDYKSGGKFAPKLCIFGDDFDIHIDENWAKLIRLVTFLTTEYLEILVTGGFHFYRYDRRAIGHGSRGGATDLWVARTGGEDWSTELVSSTDMRGFQQIIALSQASIDDIYGVYFSTNRWMQSYHFGKQFVIEYTAPKIRLLSNERALYFIQIKGGKLKTLLNGKPNDKSDEHQIGEWELAFDIPIKLINPAKVDDHYKETEAWKLSQSVKETSLMQLVLDVDHADFHFNLSRFNDPLFGDTRLSIDKVDAAIHYLKEFYFGLMKDASAHILYTVAISNGPVADRPYYAFGKADFHVYSKIPITHQNYNILKPGEEPAIVIVGMTDPRLSLPSTRLRFSGNWFLGNPLTLGTVALGADLFLKGRLLPVLERVNRATTLLPLRLDMDVGNWLVDLTTWKEKYKGKEDRLASWEELPRSHEGFEYKWDYTDEYEYNHEGRAADKATGTNFLSLKTDNRLSIPTTFRSGQLDIKIRGTTTFSIGWNRVDENVRFTAVASWEILISAVTGPDGLKFHISKEYDRHISEEDVTGDYVPSSWSQRLRPKAMLDAAFPQAVTFEEELSAFKEFHDIWASIFPGRNTYRLANPLFTNQGDLLLELRSGDLTSSKPIPRPQRPGAKTRINFDRGSFAGGLRSGPNSPRTPSSPNLPNLPSPRPPTQGGRQGSHLGKTSEGETVYGGAGTGSSNGNPPNYVPNFPPGAPPSPQGPFPGQQRSQQGQQTTQPAKSTPPSAPPNPAAGQQQGNGGANGKAPEGNGATKAPESGPNGGATKAPEGTA